jgi:hypothetical protein
MDQLEYVEGAEITAKRVTPMSYVIVQGQEKGLLAAKFTFYWNKEGRLIKTKTFDPDQ